MVTTKSHAQAPARSLDQRMEALQRANDVRVRRAQLKRDLKAGRASIETILLDPPEWVETAKVFAGLFAVILIGLFVESVIFKFIERRTVLRWGMQR